MMFRTHVAIALFFIFLFLPHVNSPFVFFIVAIFSTILPDIDTGFSKIGKAKVSKLVQFFVKHRGIVHSFTLCIFVSLILAFFPLTVSLALPFFLGYSIHLFADSITKEGIMPFWPFREKLSWKVRVNSVVETTVFTSFIIVDLFVGIVWLTSIF